AEETSNSLGSVPLPLPPSDSGIAIFVLNLLPVIVPSPVTSPFQASLIPSFDIRQQSSITFIIIILFYHMIYPLGFESNLVVFIYLLVKDDYLYIYLLSIFLSWASFIAWILFLYNKKERSLGLSLGHQSYSFQLSTKSSLSSTHFSAPANGSSSLSCTSTIKSSNSSSSNSKFCIQLYTSS